MCLFVEKCLDGLIDGERVAFVCVCVCVCVFLPAFVINYSFFQIYMYIYIYSCFGRERERERLSLTGILAGPGKGAHARRPWRTGYRGLPIVTAKSRGDHARSNR